MKESTSSGKSGRHFGHMKACSEDKLLSDFESSISHIPYSTRYSPVSWQEGAIVMIKNLKSQLSQEIRDKI